jgi:hypothetical protein
LYEYLGSLEGKIRDGIFFCVNKSDNFSVDMYRKEKQTKITIENVKNYRDKRILHVFFFKEEQSGGTVN